VSLLSGREINWNQRRELHPHQLRIRDRCGNNALEAKSGVSFVFVSGTGADSTARGSTMWARVKGKTEDTLLAMPFGSLIQALDGIKSETASVWKRFQRGLSSSFLKPLRTGELLQLTGHSQ
jgi:hypothetical protein